MFEKLKVNLSQLTFFRRAKRASNNCVIFGKVSKLEGLKNQDSAVIQFWEYADLVNLC